MTMRGRIMGLALLALLLAVGAQAQGVYTPAWSVTFADEADRMLYVRHATRDDLGYLVTFRKAAGSNIHPIYSIEEGDLRPAWYAAFAPDSQAAGVAAPGSAFNTKFRSLDAAGDWVRWVVPASAAGFTKVVVATYNVAAAGTFNARLNPAGANQDLGNVDTAVEHADATAGGRGR
jgi:hypothetical protein